MSAARGLGGVAAGMAAGAARRGPGLAETFALNAIADTSHLMRRGLPGVARGLGSTAAGVGHWMLGGDWRVLYKDAGGWNFNPALRNKIFLGLGAYGAATFGRNAYNMRQNSIPTVHGSALESRRVDDLNATGALALGLEHGAGHLAPMIAMGIM